MRRRLFLDAQHRLTDAKELFCGSLTQTAVCPHGVVKQALALNAASAINANNHPSGTAEPRHADEHLTRLLKTALGLVDVRLLDHQVVAGSGVVSFIERGLR